jgi:hypothetical protein
MSVAQNFLKAAPFIACLALMPTIAATATRAQSPPTAAPVTPAPRLPISLFFDRVPTEKITRYRDSIQVFDANGKPKFRADLDHILLLAENPDGFIIEWRLRARQVRISIDPVLDYWVSCDDVRTTGLACGSAKATSDGLIFRAAEPKPPLRAGPGLSAPEIPDCPGDVRCPKPRPKK